MCDVCPPLERHERQQETDGQRGVSSVLLKACKGCGRLIPQALTMCEQCEARQQSRHVTYNNTRRDPRAAEFYLSKEWRELRPVIMSVYEYVDIYALYVEHQLITLQDSDPIHHIIELEEDWEQRLNPLNLIPLSHRTHNTITALYKQSNASMKATQTQLRSLIDYHFKEAGGYEKVLCDRFLVAPLFSLEKTPHEKISGHRGVTKRCQNVTRKSETLDGKGGCCCMAGQRQPTDLVVMKGKNTSQKQKLRHGKTPRWSAPCDKVRPPSYLTPEQKKQFRKLSKELLAIKLIANVDCDALARLLIAQDQYIEITDKIRETPLMEDVPVYETKENPDTGEKERVQVGTRQVVNGERERLMIIQDRCMKQCRQGHQISD